ncbi:hypothetical protein DF185_04790 [Marinifilum breve]|uniref:Uncharacterized protein n=1 Tax=Marinifilum breve TaxID=2184082 RepID=A0A2V4A098_9BACT|nr:hypothetical protein DF185_04790 [Marinifilum breve]
MKTIPQSLNLIHKGSILKPIAWKIIGNGTKIKLQSIQIKPKSLSILKKGMIFKSKPIQLIKILLQSLKNYR